MPENKPSLAQLFLSFLGLGMTAFGGPAMIAYIRELSVVRRKWLDEDSFRDGVALCQSVPGATAMQTAAYVGFRTGGIPGAAASFLGFGLPAFVLMLLLSSLYARYHGVPKIAALFSGLQVVVVAIVLNATYSFGRSTLKDAGSVVVAALTAALLWRGASPFLVILGAALAGLLFFRKTRALPHLAHGGGDSRYRRQLALLLVLLASGLAALFFADRQLFHLATLMMRIDLFAFGGGFASLPLMLHEVVGVRLWMDSATFMNGIALGQVTPGPIVITSTFVGFMLHGPAGAVVATAAIFAPSFLMVALLTPVMDGLRASAGFARATKGILASFVGLLFFVALKFSLAVPWDGARVALGCAALVALFRKVDILYLVLVAAAVSPFLF